MGASGAQLNASSGVPGNFTWSPPIGLSQPNISNPILTIDTSITYVVSFTDNNNCIYRDSVSINSVKIFLTDTIISSASDCFSANGSINITVSGGTTPYTFLWSNGDITEDISLLNAGDFTVNITESGVLNCSTSFSFNVPSVLPVNINTSSDTVYCSGDSVLLSASGGVSYVWSEINGAVIGTSNPILAQPNIGLNTYIVTATNGTCSDKDTINITLLASPSADAGINVETLEGNAELIGGKPTGPSGATYSWYPAEGVNDVSSPNPSVNPSETTTYYVIVTNNLGCKAKDSVRVIVYPSIIVPSGFTPNGDGANEKWIIDFIYKYPESTVQVYNRWGQLLYESAPGYPEPWDGKYNGNDLPVGTYYYIIDVKQPLIKPYTGPITIMR
jgi:gliding motility-associated-like protein